MKKPENKVDWCSESAIEMAAQCWCDKETSMIEMDSRLATAFAKRYTDLQEKYESLKQKNSNHIKLAEKMQTEIISLKQDALKLVEALEKVVEMPENLDVTSSMKQALKVCVHRIGLANKALAEWNNKQGDKT